MLYCSQFPALVSPTSQDTNTKKTACVEDVFESMKHQLLLLVEWAKHIPEFCSLSIDDRVWLLTTYLDEAENSQGNILTYGLNRFLLILV